MFTDNTRRCTLAPIPRERLDWPCHTYHVCSYISIQPAPETEEEMMIEVFKYTERVVNMIRPRKVLFMAIGMCLPPCFELNGLTLGQDGVAPRAKMNQQRSRRFRSAQEAKEKEEAHKEAIAMWEGKL